VSILHVEIFENRGDEGLLATTDAGTIFLAVDSNAEQLACRAEIGDFELSQEPGLNFDPSFGSILWVQNFDVVDVQKHQNTITAEMEVGIGLRLGESDREQAAVNFVVPKSWCLF